MSLRIRRGLSTDIPTPLEGELLYTTDNGNLYVGFYDQAQDAVVPKLTSASLVDDSNPTLSANLDLGGNNILGTGNINIDGTITATGNINLGDGAEDNVIVGGVISSSLIPAENAVYDLGSNSERWTNGFFGGLDIDQTISAESITINSIYTQDSGLIYDHVSDQLIASTVSGNLIGSVIGDDSVLIVDGTTNQINTDLLNISLNTITSSQIDGEINFLAASSTERLRINYISNEADFTIKDFGITNGVLSPGSFFSTQRNTIESPVTVETGDPLAQSFAAGWDGNSYVSSSIIIHEVDKYQSVSAGYVPGAIKLHTFDTDTLDPKSGKGIEIDSRGFVGILNSSQPEAAIDVNGSAIVRGSVFSDNSIEIIDGIAGEVVGPIRDLTVLGNTGTPSNTDGLSPSEWLEISVNGSTRYIPLYT